MFGLDTTKAVDIVHVAQNKRVQPPLFVFKFGFDNGNNRQRKPERPVMVHSQVGVLARFLGLDNAIGNPDFDFFVDGDKVVQGPDHIKEYWVVVLSEIKDRVQKLDKVRVFVEVLRDISNGIIDSVDFNSSAADKLVGFFVAFTGLDTGCGNDGVKFGMQRSRNSFKRAGLLRVKPVYCA